MDFTSRNTQINSHEKFPVEQSENWATQFRCWDLQKLFFSMNHRLEWIRNRRDFCGIQFWASQSMSKFECLIYFPLNCSKFPRNTRSNSHNTFDGRGRCFVFKGGDHGEGWIEVGWTKFIFTATNSEFLSNFRCLGSTQHLKNLYGAGYNLEIKLKHIDGFIHSSSSFENIQLHVKKECRNFVYELFPDARIEESFGDRIACSIPQHNVSSLAQCFESLEKGDKFELI